VTVFHVCQNLCRYSNISEHYGCGKVDTVEEVLPAASLDILKGMVFGAVITCGMSQVYTSQVHVGLSADRHAHVCAHVDVSQNSSSGLP
jgi:hypothetical protein